MSNFTVGRVGLDVQVDSVTGWSEQGARVSVDGRTRYGSVAEALVVRQQLLGYVDAADESFVPVTWADQPQVDGFYRVLNAQVTATPEAAFAGVYAFSVELEKVTGFAAPLIEDVVIGMKRVSPLPVLQYNTVCVPSKAKSYAAYEVSTRLLSPVTLIEQRVGATSILNAFDHDLADSFISQFYVAPKHYYDGAATVRVGDPLRVAVGREVSNHVNDWELSNDLIQVRPASSDITKLQYRMWDETTSQWSAWHYLTVWASDFFFLNAPHTITVMANTPEAVTIRLLAATTLSPVSIDLTLRRGARYVSLELNAILLQEFGFEIEDFAGSSALTGGREFTVGGVSNFIASPHRLIGTPQPDDGLLINQARLSDGLPESVKKLSFAFGLTPSDPQQHANEYFWAASEKSWVVAR